MKNTSISYYGYFTPFGGYGIANLNWISHLTRQGLKVYPHKKFSYEPGSPEFDALTEEQKELLAIPFEKQKIGIIETTPFDFDIIDTEIKIGNTMCESSEIGKDWVNQCNKLDFIVVPNEFQKGVFINSGVSQEKVRVIRHGTWTEMFPYFERPKRDIFTFGTVGYLNDRKGVFELIRAFTSEFEPHEPVRLYLKSSNKDFGYYSRFSDSRITTDIRHVSPEELNEIYRSFDCFVFPSKAEGVGQPPREAMSTGLPTIVTNYSGLEEIAFPEYSYPLQPASLARGINPQNIEQPGDWAIIDIQELMGNMRHVYENQKEAKEKGILASKVINEEHGWTNCAKSMIELIQEL